MVGGFYHPAFRELCEAICYRKLFEAEINKTGFKECYAEFLVQKKELSKALGQKKSNIEYFKNRGVKLKITPTDEITGKYRVINIWQTGM